jgi:Ca2+-binding EF-hand superfamily protein
MNELDDVESNMNMLTVEEEAKCKEAFDAFDKDSNGSIDSTELRIVLQSNY